MSVMYYVQSLPLADDALIQLQFNEVVKAGAAKVTKKRKRSRGNQNQLLLTLLSGDMQVKLRLPVAGDVIEISALTECTAGELKTLPLGLLQIATDRASKRQFRTACSSAAPS